MLIRLLAITLLLISANVRADSVTLETPQGKLIGETVGENNSIHSFKGIPFAAPATGERRWQPPGEPPRWNGELLATSFGPNCIQQPYPENSFFYRPARLTSEDCLYLNVWSNPDTDTKKPVMVWIHGGALTRGSGATATYDGTRLAQKGVVLVTINYRLGVFGYFSHPELVAESGDSSAGNYGVLDQISALKWVQDNLAAFGGATANVPVFGESAGSWSVNLLTASPLAEGLFHKAIGESGARLDPRMELSQANANGTELAAALGANSLSELRAIPALSLQAGAQSARFQTDGIVDGWVIPDQPYNLFAQGRQHKIPVLIGYNAEEGTTLGALGRIPENDDVYIASTRQTYADLANEFLEVYPASDLRKSTLDSYRDGSFGWNMMTWARMSANVNQDAYLYYFSHRPPGPDSDTLGAYHAAEIAYAFNNAHTLRHGPTSTDNEVADLMSNYWVQFAKTGNPNLEGQPTWQSYSREEPHYMILDAAAKPAIDLTPAAWNLFDKVMANRRQ
jgi:para-nitrobenzyl esterase